MVQSMFILFVLICLNIFIRVNSLGVNRTYLIKKDFLSGAKGGEFTIYDVTGKKLQYRMETKVGATHDVRVFNPSKKLIARLKAKITAVMYKADLTIYDESLNQWINGTIQQNYKIVGNKFTIQYNQNTIVMEGTAASLDTQFIEQSSQTTLAKFHKRVSSLFWRNKYDLQVLSNKYSDLLLFLGLAARDHSNKKIWRG